MPGAAWWCLKGVPCSEGAGKAPQALVGGLEGFLCCGEAVWEGQKAEALVWGGLEGRGAPVGPGAPLGENLGLHEVLGALPVVREIPGLWR